MILLAFAKTAATLKISSINTKRTAIFLHSLPTANYLLPRGETLFHLPPVNILEIFKDSSSTTRKYSRTFSPANCLSRKSSAPENIQRLFLLQNCLSHKSSTMSWKYSKTFWAAINNSNQQQQSTAATSSSNQQQQPTAAISSSNQQQQSTAATSSSNQQQKLAATTSFRPNSSTYTIHDDFR